MSEIKKSKSGRIKKIHLKIEEGVCEHNYNVKINKHLNYCKECGRITYIKKMKNTIISKYLIKPKNYNKGIDFSPLTLFKYIIKQDYSNVISLNYSNLYLDFRILQIDLIYSLHKKFHSDLRTLYMSIYNLDRIFSSYKFKNIKDKRKINLLTICCYIITYKYFEIDNYKYHLDLNYIKKKFNISKDDIFYYELKCLKRLKYNLSPIDIFTVIELLMYTGFIFNNEDLGEISLHTIYKNITSLLDDVILEGKILKKFSCSQIAFSIIYIIRKKNGLNEKIFQEEISENFFNIKYESYEKCIKVIEENFYNNKQNNNNTIPIEDDTFTPKEKKTNFANFTSSLSPDPKLNHEFIRVKNLSYSLKPIKTKRIILNRSKSNIHNENENHILSNEKEKEKENEKEHYEHKIFNIKILKNNENIRYLLENQKNNILDKKKTTSRNHKRITFQKIENNNQKLQISNSKSLHSKMLSEDDLNKLDILREKEREKYLFTISPNDETKIKRKTHFHYIDDVNYFNKSGKKNIENLKMTLTKNKKIEKIIFPHLN